MSCDTNISLSESKKLAKKLRAEDPEQFQTLVRMHLSFVLDLNTEEAEGSNDKSKSRPHKWGLVPFSKKIRNSVKEPSSEGIPLAKSVTNQVYMLSQFLTAEENVTQEGIFRRSGKVTRQQELKSLLIRNDPSAIDLNSYSVHDVASVLKGFLSELPEPLLTEMYYPAYCQIAELCQGEQISKERILSSIQLLLLLLPQENRRTLKHLLRLLHLTASHENSNRMSAKNLATMFTPHLICPRKLSPEVFHTTAQNLSCIIVFMVKEGVRVFEVPQALTTDILAYWDRRRRNNFLERSISEANTVFTFVDRQRSAPEQGVNPTETALAQLYAHIQSLPESNKNKKRLIKQFNKENGQGTPRTKSLGDSIKKHIFNKNAKAKGYMEFTSKNGICTSDIVLNSPERKLPRTPLTYKLRMNLGNCADLKGKRKDVEQDGSDSDSNPSIPLLLTPPRQQPNMIPVPSDDLLSGPSTGNLSGGITSTPAVAVCTLTTPSGLAIDDMSPITRSAQRMPKAMQEAMVTPRSRKPVVALSGSNLHLGNTSWGAPAPTPKNKKLSWGNSQEASSQSKMQSLDVEEDSLTSPFRDYLFSRSVLTGSPVDLSFSSRTGDFDPSSSSLRTTAPEVEEDEEISHHPVLEEEDSLSASLLYFLDGGSPPSSTKSSGLRLKRVRPPTDDLQKNGKKSEVDSSITETSL